MIRFYTIGFSANTLEKFVHIPGSDFVEWFLPLLKRKTNRHHFQKGLGVQSSEQEVTLFASLLINGRKCTSELEILILLLNETCAKMKGMSPSESFFVA